MGSLTLEVDVLAGSGITEACGEAVALAGKLGISVEFGFNGVKCVAHPGGDTNTLAANIRKAMSSSHKYKFATSG